MALVFLIIGLCVLVATSLAYFPSHRNVVMAGVTFVLGLMIIEFAHLHIAAIVTFVVAALCLNIAVGWLGWLGVAVWSVVALLMAWRTWTGRLDGVLVETEVRRTLDGDQGEPPPRAWSLSRLLWCLPRRPPEVVKIGDVPFVERGSLTLTCDIYRPNNAPEGAPVLLQIHGGGWMIGDKGEQGLPMMHHLAGRGWVCVSANYRLSPRATYPDHLDDVKAAISWVKANIDRYGGDPNQVFITGNSAGAHLVSLAALTAADPASVESYGDTRVRGCVSLYGVYDLTNCHGQWPHRGMAILAKRLLLKADIDESPEVYEAASPLHRVCSEAPPFLVIHGGMDSLAPVEEARIFSRALRSVSKRPVVYAELPHAQHAFDLVPSLRTQTVVQAIEGFLDRVRFAESPRL